MRSHFFLFVLVLLKSCNSKRVWKTLNHIRTRTPENDQAEAVKELIFRLLPTRASEFRVVVNSSLSVAGKDVFAFQTVDGKLTVWGNTGSSTAWGFHHFLKYYCKAHISWSGNQLHTITTPLPVVKQLVKIDIPHRFRYYQNVCTSSYSFVWWNWTRWEEEIDWMAMNGINLPLAFTAQETIWQRIYLRLGVTQEDLDKHFGGPAFLAWSRMGNINGWGGPLPNPSWYQGQMKLQQKILKRMRSLGMTPVLPGFAGHIPEGLTKVFPNASVSKLDHWGHFGPPYVPTYLLDPTDPLFRRIGKMFIEEQANEYNGTDHIYNGDTFNEMRPKTTSITYLGEVSKAVYQAMADGDPKAVWLMQGWLFVSDPGFWQPAQVKAYLQGVPLGKMVVLDLYAEISPVWMRTDSFYGQPFIWCMLHNFGGNIGMHGTMQTIASEPVKALHGNNSMVGIGISPEGIETNYVLYDLMLEMGWRQEGVEPKNWIKNYIERRYGVENSEAYTAWQNLLLTVYNDSKGVGKHCRAVPVMRPSFQLQPDIWYDRELFLKAWKSMVIATPSLTSSSTFRYDVVDVTRQALQVISISFYKNLLSAYETKSLSNVEEAGNELLRLIADMDEVVLTNEYFLLGRWLAGVKRMATTQAEEKLLEFNARNQITMWGPRENIEDYANKMWSGLLNSYYKQRWQLFVDFLLTSVYQKVPFNQTLFLEENYEVENSWNHGREDYTDMPEGNTESVVVAMFEKYHEKLHTSKMDSFWPRIKH